MTATNPFSQDGMTVNSPWVWRFHCCGRRGTGPSTKPEATCEKRAHLRRIVYKRFTQKTRNLPSYDTAYNVGRKTAQRWPANVEAIGRYRPLITLNYVLVKGANTLDKSCDISERTASERTASSRWTLNRPIQRSLRVPRINNNKNFTK